MSASKIIEFASSGEIQAAQAMALLRLKSRLQANGAEFSLEYLGKVMDCCKQSVSQYIISDTEMSSASWIKAVNRWPELEDMMLAELDEAEKQAAARQRAFKLQGGN